MLRETMATMRVIDVRDVAPSIPKVLPGEDVVVLVHGLLATAGAFRPLRARLEGELGVKTASFTSVPFTSVRRIAKQLEVILATIPDGARIHLVGHSLGGVVVRWFVQERRAGLRVVQTISMGAPFGGAPLAKKLPVLVGAELHPKSSLLSRLRETAHGHPVPHLSIAGTHDKTAPPHSTSTLPHGDLIMLDGLGHNGLLFDQEAMNIVLTRIARASS
jgi:pimeloyl-ACP methyl ester carboxylesterase